MNDVFAGIVLGLMVAVCLAVAWSLGRDQGRHDALDHGWKPKGDDDDG